MQKTIPYSQKQRIHCTLAKLDFWHFCKIKAPKFYIEEAAYLKEFCQALQDFLEDDNELLIINMPPRHGKSRTASLFVQWALGNNNNLKIISASYNEKLSRTFSKAARNSIQEEKLDLNKIIYNDIFPSTQIEHGSSRVDLWKLENSEENNYLATSPSSTTTGMGADIVLIDDIVKNAYEACHAGILEDHFEWFTDTMYSRLEGLSKVVLIMTRWATKDLAGRLIELFSTQDRKFKVISKRAFDGETMLNDKVLSFKRYQNLIQTIGDEIVQANYNQEPIDLKGALYSKFMTYNELPHNLGHKQIIGVCDPADTGDDYLCMIIYALINNFAYVLDVYYTKDPVSTTEKQIPIRLKKHNANILYYENNFGGSSLKRIWLKECAAINYNVGIVEFSQTKNKQARIYAYSSIATKYVYMPDGWEHLFPEFYKEITEYQREGTNAYDDGADCLTCVCERISRTIEPYAR